MKLIYRVNINTFQYNSKTKQILQLHDIIRLKKYLSTIVCDNISKHFAYL